MKLLLTLAFALLSLVASAQNAAYLALPKDSASQKVAYTAVVQVPGVPKDELFTRAKEWSARSFGDNKVAERMNDRQAGTLLAECEMKQPPLSFTDTHSNLYRFTLAIYVRDGRFMYRLDQFSYQNINPAIIAKDAAQRVPFEYYATIKENKRVTATLTDFDRRMQLIIADMTKAMSATPATSKRW